MSLVELIHYAEAELPEPLADASAFMISNIFLTVEGRSFGCSIISTHYGCFVSDSIQGYYGKDVWAPLAWGYLAFWKSPSDNNASKSTALSTLKDLTFVSGDMAWKMAP